MLDQNRGMNAAAANDLGMVICKNCGEVISTLPTDGVKKIYGACQSNYCTHKIQKIAGESECR